MTNKFIKALEGANRIGISGHRRPDGDCVGSCLGLYNYIRDVYPEKQVTVYLEPIQPEFKFLRYSETINHTFTDQKGHDLFVVLDCGDEERLAEYAIYLKKAKCVFCVDHHISNSGFGDDYIIEPNASSTSEMLFDLFDYDKISKSCAEALYMGIVHDTGVFKHSNTTRKTMHAAGDLVAKGLNTSRIIDDTFYRKTFIQNKVHGRALIESELTMEGKVIYSVISENILESYGAKGSDLDGTIDQMRMTEGVECAILMHQTGQDVYKISMRSNDIVNVSTIAASFGGGGHVRASGCTMYGLPNSILEKLFTKIKEQLVEAGCLSGEE